MAAMEGGGGKSQKSQHDPSTSPEDGEIAASLLDRTSEAKRLIIQACSVSSSTVTSLRTALQDNHQLESLTMDRCLIAPLPLRHLMLGILGNPRSLLSELTLEDCALEDDHARSFVEAWRFSKKAEGSTFPLSRLSLAHNHVGDAGLVHLAMLLTPPLQTWLPKLAFLNLEDNRLGDKGVEQLARAISASTNLCVVRELNLGKNRIGPVGGAILCESLSQVKSLTSLHLHSNRLGAQGASALSTHLLLPKSGGEQKRGKASPLLFLDIRNNSMGETGVAGILRALKEADQQGGGRAGKRLHIYLGGNGMGTCACQGCINDRVVDACSEVPEGVHLE